VNIILIGPVSGNVERAKRVFTQAEREYRVRGHNVVQNPMRNHVAGHSEAWYMKQSLSNICNLVDEDTPELLAVLLPGWGCSKGSIAEYWLCEKLGIASQQWNPYEGVL
jgi:hypothetical protein